jgi:hypothetical protein
LIELNAEASKFVLETGHAAATVDKMLIATGPGWMGHWINFQTHFVTFCAPRRISDIFGAISHDDFDLVIVWVNIFFQRSNPSELGAANNRSAAIVPCWRAIYAIGQQKARHMRADALRQCEQYDLIAMSWDDNQDFGRRGAELGAQNEHQRSGSNG